MRYTSKGPSFTYGAIKSWVQKGRNGTTRTFNATREWRIIGDTARLYLHGNLIAEITDKGEERYTLAGWDTPTTRATLTNECDVYVRSFYGRPAWNDHVITVDGWFGRDVHGTVFGNEDIDHKVIDRKALHAAIKQHLTPLMEARKAQQTITGIKPTTKGGRLVTRGWQIRSHIENVIDGDETVEELIENYPVLLDADRAFINKVVADHLGLYIESTYKTIREFAHRNPKNRRG
jgi:uncharacterized protein (DUF433 family)